MLNADTKSGISKFIISAEENYEPGKIDRMIIASRPGIGKTRALMQLPNSLYIDIEDSTGHFKGKADIINVKKIMEENDWGPVFTIKEVCNHMKSEGKRYKFLVVDTISVIDDIAETLALALYKQSPLGKNFKGNSVFELEYGAGYYWHRLAFNEIVENFEDIADTIIFVAHIKDSSLKKDGETISVQDLRLTGSLKEIISSKQDISGVLVIDKDDPNKRYLDFRKTDTNQFMKSRVEHLSGDKILISELKDGEFTTYWDNVFLSLKEKPKEIKDSKK